MPSLIQSSRYPLPIEYLLWALSLKASYRHRLGLEAVMIKQTISVTFLYWSSLGLFPKISCTASERSLSALRLLLKLSEGLESFGHALVSECLRLFPEAVVRLRAGIPVVLPARELVQWFLDALGYHGNPGFEA